jgi:murein DD-endopeptidase MepM/ murein hydrolase activator NlpD
MRKGVCVLICGLAAFAAAASASADDLAGTSTTGGTPTTTDPVTTTVPTTSTAAPTTTQGATAQASYAPAQITALPHCASAGAAAIVLPQRTPLTVGAVPAQLGASAYPAAGTVITFDAADAFGTSCRPGAVSVRSVSLFGGAVTATSVSARNGVGSAAGVAVQGSPVSLGAGASMALGAWGLLTTSARVGARLRAPLSLQLLEPRGGLPAGTVVLVGYGASSAAAAHSAGTTATGAASPTSTNAGGRQTQSQPALPPGLAPGKHKKHKKVPQPLKVTPPLGLSHYDFPVAGGADYGDTYGAERSDISDGWHHGDDLFAPLGTPVVAVADGTLSLVGYERLGGWRLWLQDSAGNQFYYAHLSAYSRAALKGGAVKAGEVLGFLGRTGDAFTTTPHLHFEVHPHQLLSLGYDGAVDPTGYLHGWTVVHVAHAPKPVHPAFPSGEGGIVAKTVWRQLLASGLIRLPKHAAPVFRQAPLVRRSDVLPQLEELAPRFAATAAVAAPPGRGTSLPPIAWALLTVALTLAVSFGTVAATDRLRLRRRAEAHAPETAAPPTTES